MSTLRKIHCQCGQSFTERTLDGEARTSCPVCKRPIPLAEPKEALLVAELVEHRGPDAGERWLEGYRPTPVTDFVSAGAKEAEAEAHYGLWRDGDMIVVCRSNHRFPQRCLMTNELLPDDWKPITLDYLPNRRLWSLFGKSIGRSIGRALYGQQIPLNGGVSRTWQQRHLLHRIAGNALIWAGALLAIPVSVLTRGPAMPMLVIGGLIGGGLIVLLLSLPLRVWAVEGDYVWLRGANSSLIASLPPRPIGNG
jgi:hypothetical protein